MMAELENDSADSCKAAARDPLRSYYFSCSVVFVPFPFPLLFCGGRVMGPSTN
jgi:hypothetical protein